MSEAEVEATMSPKLSAADPRQAQLKSWGHRIYAPDKTLDIIRPHFTRMGITRLADITGLDHIGIPVAQAIRPLGRSLSVSQGKGVSLSAALASAAMECAEGWHAENIEIAQARATPRQVASVALDIFAYPNAPPVAQATDTATWIEGALLWGDAPILVPLDLIDKDYIRPPDLKWLPRSTNGLAAGNTLAEAVASALHEIIERDCQADYAALDEATRHSRTIKASDAATFHADVATLIEAIKAAGLVLELHDMSNDLNVPAYRARLLDVDDSIWAQGRPRRRPSVGSGAHLDPATAMVRAITEAAQSRLTEIAGSRDDLELIRYQPSERGNVPEMLNLLADEQAQETRTPPTSKSGETAAADVETLTDILKKHDVGPVAVVDLSKPDMDIAVVKVVAPYLGYLIQGGVQQGHRHQRSATK